jgi:cold shock CspA family protein
MPSGARLFGRIQRVLRRDATGKGYGFILTDTHAKFFFHQDDVIGQLLPEPASHVSFDVLPTSTPKLHDRAVNIQIEAVPK